MPLTEPIVQLRLSEGRVIQTFVSVLQHDPESLFAELLSDESVQNKQLVRIECMTRDRKLLSFIVDCLRKSFILISSIHRVSGRMRQQSDNKAFEFIAPEDFGPDEWRALIAESHYWRLSELEELFRRTADNFTNTITISYHGALSSGKLSGANLDVNFRRIHRIIVHGQAWVCREVFGHQLNETRDGNIDSTRYTSRFYLSHNFLEQAFDTLSMHRFKLISSTSHTPMAPQAALMPNRSTSSKGRAPAATQTAHERQFLHYSQFVFCRSN